MKTLLLRNGTVVTMDRADSVIQCDILINDEKIVKIGTNIQTPENVEVLDCSGRILIPGFVQTHVHLCQSLWRNLADDLSLMEWLRKWTWPLEAVHDETTLRAAARLACAELLLSGTTTINDMGTVRHYQALVDAAASTGIRGIFSKVLMDEGHDALKQEPEVAIEEALSLRPPSNAHRRVKIALAPRFAVSSSLRLLEKIAMVASEREMLIHTHASENSEENRITMERFGMRPIALFASLDLLGPRLLLAHCVDITEDEIETLATTRTAVLHCPSANLKLGSGIAPIPAMLAAGVRVSLGADGPPCNNNLSAFQEMRTAALIQKGIHGPKVMPAYDVLKMATLKGAEVLGMADEVGSIEEGKFADIVVLNASWPWCVPWEDPASAIVYSMNAANVEHVIVAGQILVRDRKLVHLDLLEVVREGMEASKLLRSKAMSG